MDCINLRILTKKSRLGFGRHHDMTVNDILICDPEYIAWAYYSLANISFCEEVVSELKLIPIEKPGKDEEKLREYKRKKSAEYTSEQRQHGRYARWRKFKGKAKSKLVQVHKKTRYTKEQLQAINHGHIKKERS